MPTFKTLKLSHKIFLKKLDNPWNFISPKISSPMVYVACIPMYSVCTWAQQFQHFLQFCMTAIVCLRKYKSLFLENISPVQPESWLDTCYITTQDKTFLKITYVYAQYQLQEVLKLKCVHVCAMYVHVSTTHQWFQLTTKLLRGWETQTSQGSTLISTQRVNTMVGICMSLHHISVNTSTQPTTFNVWTLSKMAGNSIISYSQSLGQSSLHVASKSIMIR